MYDPSAYFAQPSTSQTYNPNSPPLWSGVNTQYYPGAVVWYRGTLWRCEVPHLSDSNTSGAPDSALHLWTPINSETPYGQEPPRKQGFEGFSQTYPVSPSEWTPSCPPAAGPSSSKPHIIAPQPKPINELTSRPDPHGRAAAPPAGMSEDVDDSSPDSQGTVTASSSRGPSGLKTSYQGLGMSTAQFFSSKADESLRFLVAKQESSKAINDDEWKDELKGKRVWRVGGLGMWAYGMDAGVEERKAAMWRKWGDKGKGREEWLEASKERTAFYEQARGVKPLVSWKIVQPGTPFTFPPDALQIGHDGGSVQGHPLFSARAWYGGGLHLGKAGPHLATGCCISYGGAEIMLDTYEVLCAKPDPTLLKWICFQHGESVKVEGWQPVEGGRERDGQSLFVAKGEWEGGEHPGKCRITDDHAHIGWGGGEVWIRPFYVLAYNNALRR